jgi:hypothetical protein
MNLVIKDEYLGQKLSVSNITVNVSDIKANEYLFYYNNGLSFIFRELTKKEVAKLEAKNYIKEA